MIFFKSRCYNGGAQHRFRGRFTVDKIPPDVVRPYKGPVGGLVMLIEAGTEVHESYHGDVCVWCGMVVNAPTTKA